MKVAIQPFQKRWLENSAAPVKSVACQPNQFRLAKPFPANVLQLHLELFAVDDFRHPHRRMPIEERELHARLGKMLPDELQHQQLVEIRVEQRPDDGIEFPIVVVRAFCKVDDHRRRAALINSLEEMVQKTTV